MFDRVPTRFRPVIERAFDILPTAVKEAVPQHFLCGVSPIFVGLHYYESPIPGDGGYEGCAHACFAYHSSDGVPRAVLPDCLFDYYDPVATVIHEVGHLFDEASGFTLEAPETTILSTQDRYERIAEAFETILAPSTSEHETFVAAEAFRPLRFSMGLL